MNQKAAKGIVYFLLAMLFFTFASWKLDELRTPRVLCTDLSPGMIHDTAYGMVAPSEAVYGGGSPYVYVVEDSKSTFYPVVARQAIVTVLESGEGQTAIQGLYSQTQVVRFADRALSGSTVPVRLWGEKPLEGRVEVVPFEDLDVAENLLREAAAAEKWSWEISREEDRLVVENVDPFTAQAVRAALAAGGIESAALDYTWGPAVLAQSGRLWIVWAAALGLWLLWSLIFAQGRRELARTRDALETQYLGAYLSEAGVRLLAEGIVLAVAVILTAVGLQWLWRVELMLPRDLLPEDSFFNLEYYRMWASGAFPEGWCSAYGAELAAGLKHGYALALAECAALTVCAVVLGRMMKRHIGRKNTIAE